MSKTRKRFHRNTCWFLSVDGCQFHGLLKTDVVSSEGPAEVISSGHLWL